MTRSSGCGAALRGLSLGAVGMILFGVQASGCSSSKSCIPGQSIACVGVGGCRGGQQCTTDGSGYGPCQCGSSTSATGSGGTTGWFDQRLDERNQRQFLGRRRYDGRPELRHRHELRTSRHPVSTASAGLHQGSTRWRLFLLAAMHELIPVSGRWRSGRRRHSALQRRLLRSHLRGW